MTNGLHHELWHQKVEQRGGCLSLQGVEQRGECVSHHSLEGVKQQGEYVSHGGPIGVVEQRGECLSHRNLGGVVPLFYAGLRNPGMDGVPYAD